jgi:hypothetical protein
VTKLTPDGRDFGKQAILCSSQDVPTYASVDTAASYFTHKLQQAVALENF